MKDIINIIILISPVEQYLMILLEIGHGVHVPRRLFGAKDAVEVTADGNVMAIACDLADMVPVVDKLLHPDIELPRIGDGVNESDVHRPTVEHTADHCAAGNEHSDLFVAQLSLRRSNLPHIMVTGPNRSLVQVHRLIETLVCEVCDIEYQLQLVDLPEQLNSFRRERPFHLRSRRVSSGTDRKSTRLNSSP